MKKFKLEIKDAIYFQREGIDCIEFLRKYGIHDNEFRVYSSKVELTFSEKEVLESTLLKKIFKESNNVTLECQLGHFNEMCDIKKTYELQPDGCKEPIQKDNATSKLIFYKQVNQEIEEIKEVMKWVGEWYPKIRTNSSSYTNHSPFLFETRTVIEIGKGVNIKGFDLYKLTHDGIDKEIEITEEEKEKILKQFREFLDTLKFDIEKMKEIMKEEEEEEIKDLEKEKEKLLKEIEELEETKEELQEEIKELEKRERNIYYPIYTPSQLKGVLRKLGMQG